MTFEALENLNSFIAKLDTRVPKELMTEVAPKVSRLLIQKAARIIRDKLPDGDRSLQSRKSRERFPYKLRDRVRYKIIKDNSGILAIAGVDYRGQHVRFDFGNKAKSAGRTHVLWGKRLATPPNRVQRKELQDIPQQVKVEMAPVIEQVLREAVFKALSNVT